MCRCLCHACRWTEPSNQQQLMLLLPFWCFLFFSLEIMPHICWWHDILLCFTNLLVWIWSSNIHLLFFWVPSHLTCYVIWQFTQVMNSWLTVGSSLYFFHNDTSECFFLRMPTFMSCLCSVLCLTNYVNYKERLTATPAFGNYDFRFSQNTCLFLLALQLAVCMIVKAAVGTSTSSL